MNPVELLLREKIGLDAASVGSSSIERTVRLRMKILGLKKPEDYQRLLESSRTEWDELVETVVVTETWFFRDREPFAALVELVRDDWLPQHPTGLRSEGNDEARPPRRSAEYEGGQRATSYDPTSRPCRILSLPCSSGEEPYSLVMTLLDADFPPERFAIDAVDLSARALARAQRAVYGKNSFRGKNLDFREKYFQVTKDGYALQPRVHECVRFYRANIFEDKFLSGQAAYDFIFCRNLLIYFDRETQAKALETLRHLLAPRGVLFVGPAELPLVTAQGFVSANVPMAFACRRADDVPATPIVPRRHATRATKPTLVVSAPLLPVGRTKQPAANPAAPQPWPDLAAARQLADAGKLNEAAEVCQAHLSRQGPSVQAYYLLGLVRDADGDPQAMDYYRKALYLEPNHYETLLQISLLLEKNGDPAGARTFKRRAERVQQKS